MSETLGVSREASLEANNNALIAENNFLRLAYTTVQRNLAISWSVFGGVTAAFAGKLLVQEAVNTPTPGMIVGDAVAMGLSAYVSILEGKKAYTHQQNLKVLRTETGAQLDELGPPEMPSSGMDNSPKKE